MKSFGVYRFIGAALLSALAFQVSAQSFPSKTVTIVVPFPAGGALDTVARALAEEMRKTLGQAVVVDNKAGAGGTVGSSMVARANPDGHTLLLGSVATHAIASGLYAKLPYDPLKDFAPISQITGGPLVLAVPEQVKFRSVEELVIAAKERPGAFNYASTGNGTAVHLAGEMFKSAAGINTQHIAYKGGPQAMTAMLAGEVTYIIGNTQLVLPFIQSGKMHALAVTGDKRAEALPELPTFKEAGIPGVDIVTWFGLFAPAGTPKDVIERLNADAVKALSKESVRKQLATLGDYPVGTSVADFTTFVRTEHARWVNVVKTAGVKAD